MNHGARPPDIAVLASFSGEGGVERMLLNLVNAFAERGLRIHLLSIKAVSLHLNDVHPDVERIRLGSRHTATSLLPLIRYLRRYRPPCMLVAKDRAGRLAVRAKGLAEVETRLVLRLGTNLSEALKQKNAFQRWLRLAPIRRLYPKLDGVIAVSEGVARDTLAVAGLDPGKVTVVRNPVLTPRITELAKVAALHPWLNDKTCPVVIGAGRLTVQKDFATLIRGFAEVRHNRAARLIILGEGDKRAELLALIKKLDLADSVDLPGFTVNPYAFMARADLFVLSSRWEGSPNVLTEALALGTPVVSTDCPSGPAELLDGGRIAPLVPVGDWRGLAQRMEEVLTNPPKIRALTNAVREYELETSASRYLEVLGLPANRRELRAPGPTGRGR